MLLFGHQRVPRFWHKYLVRRFPPHRTSPRFDGAFCPARYARARFRVCRELGKVSQCRLQPGAAQQCFSAPGLAMVAIAGQWHSIWEPKVPAADSRSSRSRMLRTGPAVQKRCPRAVGMPRAVRAAAMAYGAVMPLARISAMIGASATARASACAMQTRRAASRASGVATALIDIASPRHNQTDLRETPA
jgi:hypothetical protein